MSLFLNRVFPFNVFLFCQILIFFRLSLWVILRYSYQFVVFLSSFCCYESWVHYSASIVQFPEISPGIKLCKDQIEFVLRIIASSLNRFVDDLITVDIETVGTNLFRWSTYIHTYMYKYVCVCMHLRIPYTPSFAQHWIVAMRHSIYLAIDKDLSGQLLTAI